MARFRLVLVLGLVFPGIPGCGSGGGETGREEEPRAVSWPVVDTGQVLHYDNEREVVAPEAGEPFWGQDADYAGHGPAYTDHGDGTVTDLVTGLMWSQSPDTNQDGKINYQDKMTPEEAEAWVASWGLGGYSDWRIPSIRDLYTLILFSGCDVPSDAQVIDPPAPFMDTRYFSFSYGDVQAGERIIDAQYLSSTRYVGTTMNGQATVFGVNFADGRIKGYPAEVLPGQTEAKRFYVLVVRGSNRQGTTYRDNGDGTITDASTGLMWTKADSGFPMLWEEALAWAEAYEGCGYSDWRLPNAKELQGLVDYSRAPDVTGTAAIDPLFDVTPWVNEAGASDFPWYWTGTTHVNSSRKPGGAAVYICFGRALGFMNGRWLDVHGAGAQRSDPKTGDPSDYPQGFGPQGDAVRIRNFVRLVRGGEGQGGSRG